MNMIDLNISKGAAFSPDRKYRYALWRIWQPNKPLLGFVGLNPSIASEITDDPTVTRNMARAYRNGFGGLIHANLFAFISTNPIHLMNQADVIGELNDDYLKEIAQITTCQLCGWGSFKAVTKRCQIVLKMLPNPCCVGVNSDGQPRHPLYVSYEVPIAKYQFESVMSLGV